MFDDEVLIDLSALKQRYEFHETLMLDGVLISKNFKELQEILKRSSGKDKVVSIIFEYDCSLEDCTILEYFPNVTSLLFNGPSLKSIKGIKALIKLESLVIKFPLFEKFDFSELNGVSLWSLRLWGLSQNISNSLFGVVKSVERLVLHDSTLNDLSVLLGKCISELEFFNGRFVQLNYPKNLNCNMVKFSRCSRFSKIQGLLDLQIVDLSFESCNKFQYDDLIAMKRCERLTVRSCKVELSLNKLCSIPGLHQLRVVDSKVNIDVTDALVRDNTIQGIYIFPIHNKVLNEMKAAYPGIIISGVR